MTATGFYPGWKGAVNYYTIELTESGLKAFGAPVSSEIEIRIGNIYYERFWR